MRGWKWLKSIGQTVQRDNYDLVYTAPLLPSDLKGDTAEQLFYRFNNEHPTDYRHPSMSVSDIVAIKRGRQGILSLLRQLRLCRGSRIPAG